MVYVNHTLEELRHLVCEPPSRKNFRAITLALESCQGADLELALDYLEPHLESWPQEHRRTPTKWLKRLIRGKREPRMRLCSVLSLSDKRLSDKQVVAFTRMDALRNLTDLDLSGNPLGPRAFGAIAEASFAVTLSALDLSGTRPGPEGVERLAAVPRGRWRTLSLRECGLTDADVAVLCRSGALSTLRSLDLSHNNLGDDAVEHLMSAEPLAQLEHLDLSHNALLSQSMFRFDDVGALGALTALHLKGNPGAEMISPRAIDGRPHLASICADYDQLGWDWYDYYYG